MEQSLLTSPGSSLRVVGSSLRVGCAHLLAGALWVGTGDNRNPLDWPPVHGVNLQDVQIHFKTKEVKLLSSSGEKTV